MHEAAVEHAGSAISIASRKLVNDPTSQTWWLSEAMPVTAPTIKPGAFVMWTTPPNYLSEKSESSAGLADNRELDRIQFYKFKPIPMVGATAYNCINAKKIAHDRHKELEIHSRARVPSSHE